MIRYHKSQINEHQLILILHSLCNVHPTKTPSKLTNSLSMQGIDISRLCLNISDTFPVFRLWPERRDLSWVVSGCDGGSPGSQCGPRVPQWSPASADGQQHRGRSVSQCWTVTECRAPDNRAATDTIHSGAQARNVINTHMVSPPMSHVGVILHSAVVIVWLMILALMRDEYFLTMLLFKCMRVLRECVSQVSLLNAYFTQKFQISAKPKNFIAPQHLNAGVRQTRFYYEDMLANNLF